MEGRGRMGKHQSWSETEVVLGRSVAGVFIGTSKGRKRRGQTSRLRIG